MKTLSTVLSGLYLTLQRFEQNPPLSLEEQAIYMEVAATFVRLREEASAAHAPTFGTFPGGYLPKRFTPLTLTQLEAL